MSKDLKRLTRDSFLNRKVWFGCSRNKIVASRKYLKQFAPTLKELDVKMASSGPRLLKEFGLCLPQLEVLKCQGSSALEEQGVFPKLKELHLRYQKRCNDHRPDEVFTLRWVTWLSLFKLNFGSQLSIKHGGSVHETLRHWYKTRLYGYKIQIPYKANSVKIQSLKCSWYNFREKWLFQSKCPLSTTRHK